MALLKASRTAQWPLVAEFAFNYNDTMVDVNGATKSFGSTYTDAGTFEVIPMPPGAVIIGGELLVETAGAGPTAYTVSVGNSSSATAYLAATSVLSTGRTALTGLGLGSNDGKNVRITIASTVANATAGKVRVRVMYTMDGKADSVQIA